MAQNGVEELRRAEDNAGREELKGRGIEGGEGGGLASLWGVLEVCEGGV